MTKRILLGIDAGGTHTDAVLLTQEEDRMACVAKAKVPTNHEDLTASIREVLSALSQNGKAKTLLPQVTHVTLGTTLAVNAIVQNRLDPVGLLLSAGPGLAPERFALGDTCANVPGGLDHRGVEVTPLKLDGLDRTLEDWKKQGIKNVACISKFSPRNPSHECALEQKVREHDITPHLGHQISGALNFPRRIATTWYNAAVSSVSHQFIDAVCAALEDYGIQASTRLLKADGGAIPLELAKKEPVQTILSGPAASVMGVLALADELEGASVLLDIGGTTTDIALIIDGSPVLDRNGMRVNGRRTLVRSLASRSIGVGGDSHISRHEGTIQTGPLRMGNAMAFGGSSPTLLDALNVAGRDMPQDTGDRARSREGIHRLADEWGLAPEDLAEQAIQSALSKIRDAVQGLLEEINSHPIYTLRALREYTKISPDRILLVGGPAECLKTRIEELFSLPVLIPEQSEVANAIGAAVTRPTDILEAYADTGKRTLRVPRLDLNETLVRSCTLETIRTRALELLRDHLNRHNIHDAEVEVLEEDVFAVLNDYGASSRDIRVTCQAVPGITGKPTHADRTL